LNLLSVPTVKFAKNLKIQDDHILATVGPIATRIGTLAQFDPFDNFNSCNVDAAYLCNHEFLDSFQSVLAAAFPVIFLLFTKFLRNTSHSYDYTSK